MIRAAIYTLVHVSACVKQKSLQIFPEPPCTLECPPWSRLSALDRSFKSVCHTKLKTTILISLDRQDLLTCPIKESIYRDVMYVLFICLFIACSGEASQDSNGRSIRPILGGNGLSLFLHAVSP